MIRSPSRIHLGGFLTRGEYPEGEKKVRRMEVSGEREI